MTTIALSLVDSGNGYQQLLRKDAEAAARRAGFETAPSPPPLSSFVGDPWPREILFPGKRAPGRQLATAG